MPIRISDSLTKKKQDFLPIQPGKVKMYSCGVTVYDECHIGHARSLYIFDVIRRYLKYKGFDVTFVRNITDIDDKIINKAKESGISAKEVSEKYIASYYNDLEALSIERADFEPKATENISGMVKHIEGLIEKGFAYEVSGDVYFSVRKFKDYGKLSGQSIEQMQEAVRIEKDLKKKDPLDFALWKKSNEDEPLWDSPWGKGRPGWHIECSVMSKKFLGETFDIHAGGRDLIFPHHENEIAQSEALTGKPFAKYWIHHGLLTINGQKMSKSAGNFITIQDALKKYNVDDLKLFFLSSHYGSPIDFTEEKMVEAHKAKQRFEILFQKIFKIKMPPRRSEVAEIDFIKENKERFLEAMDDDFNTAKALGCLFDLVTDTNKFIDSGKNNSNYYGVIDKACSTILDLSKNVFGLFLLLFVEEPSLPKEFDSANEQKIANLLKEREEFRLKRDFKRADELRKELRTMGVIVEDTKEGQVWRRA